MSKLHYCEDGMSVVDKVMSYQETKKNSEYLFVYKYYQNYKDKWRSDLKEYLDYSAFNSEFDFKLCRAVDTFDSEQAFTLCEKNNWSLTGAFNRWFYAVLRNWKSNVKTSAYRQKKRPSVQCPICGRFVTKIDEIHLAHYKSKSDLPKVFSWKGIVYSVVASPGSMANSWGKYSFKKIKDLNSGENKKNYKKEKVKWIWFTKDGKRGVVCPFTKNIIPQIDNSYIINLPKKYNRYAKPFTWHEFTEEFPYPVLISAEVFSLDYNLADEEAYLRESISVNSTEFDNLREEDISLEADKTALKYEHVFHLIESHIPNEKDQKILKLAAVGHSDSSIAVILNIDKKEVRQSKREMKLCSDLRKKLLESV